MHNFTESEYQLVSNFLNNDDNKKLCKEFARIGAKEEKIGFNIFQMISNTYYRENFHSYIIYNLLSQKCHLRMKYLQHKKYLIPDSLRGTSFLDTKYHLSRFLIKQTDYRQLFNPLL
jgi:hypothetical protein